MNLIALLEVGTLYEQFKNNLLWPFDNIVLDSRLDKTVLINTILQKSSQATPIYDTCHTFLAMTNNFFQKYNLQITKMVDTLFFEYNPIWNRDGTVKEIRNIERKREESVGDDLNKTYGESGDSSSENTVSAYNSSSYQPYDHDSSEYSRKGNENSNRDINTDENESTGENFIQVSQGNIGVTTTQSMIREERELQEFNIYNWIADKFNDELFYKIW